MSSSVISEAKIQEVKDRIDLVALVQRHGVELKRSGRTWAGRCPFHQEKSPSFYIWPEEKRFKCFGCQASGDALSFVQRLSGKGFVDTVTDLAQELGIQLDTQVDPGLAERQQVKDATDFAARHFEKRLWDPQVGKAARDYLARRGLSEATIRAFGLGLAPPGWSDLADAMREHGFLGFAEKATLVAPRPKGEGYYDFFRNRLMIPIRSPEGRTIAFGGRALSPEDSPKYLNSRENRLYVKSDVLYGADRARDEIRKRKAAVLTEGYFDCIGLHQVGVTHVVALCSTTLTAGHLTLLRKLEAKELVLLLDGDRAGRDAVDRLAPAILGAGMASKVALLPEGDDPDTFALKVGREGVLALLEAAKPLTTHLFDACLPDGPLSSFEAKMSALERLKPIVADLPVGLARSALVSAMSRHFGLPGPELETTLKAKAPPRVKPAPKPPAPQRQEPPPDQLEATFAAAVLRRPQLLASDPHRVADELKHLGIRTLVAAIETGASADALYEASDQVKGALTRAQDLLPGGESALEQAFVVVCRRLKVRAIEERLAGIARLTASAPGASSELTEEARELLQERGALLALKRSLLSSK